MDQELLHIPSIQQHTFSKKKPKEICRNLKVVGDYFLIICPGGDSFFQNAYCLAKIFYIIYRIYNIIS